MQKGSLAVKEKIENAGAVQKQQPVTELKLRRKLLSEEMLNVELQAELKAAKDLVRELQNQLTAVSEGGLVSVEQLRTAQWANHAMHREAAALRSELEAAQASTHAKHEAAVDSLLWLEKEARAGKAAMADLHIVEAKLRKSEARAQSLELEVATLTAEVNRLRRRGAGVTEPLAHVRRPAPVGAPHPRLPSPTQLLPAEIALNRYTRTAIGTRARLDQEHQRLAARHEELAAARRDLDAREWLAAAGEPRRLRAQGGADAQYARALRQLDALG